MKDDFVNSKDLDLSKITWCLKQRRGVKLVELNDNLSKAYLKKSELALRSMNVNMAENIVQWAVEAAYYSRYYSIYALLQKCGIESEIHDCSLNLIEFLFKDKFGAELIEELKNAKNQRIDLVYYTNRFVSEEDIRKNIDSAPAFVLNAEKINSELSNEEIEDLRLKLTELINCEKSK